MSNSCGTCKHWNKLPADPLNLGATPTGECREQLHLVAFPVQSARGMGIQQMPMYAVVPENYPACSRHQKTGSGIANIIGKWPGDETDDQINRALDELS